MRWQESKEKLLLLKKHKSANQQRLTRMELVGWSLGGWGWRVQLVTNTNLLWSRALLLKM